MQRILLHTVMVGFNSWRKFHRDLKQAGNDVLGVALLPLPVFYLKLKNIRHTFRRIRFQVKKIAVALDLWHVSGKFAKINQTGGIK